jgi:hypothetical protein
LIAAILSIFIVLQTSHPAISAASSSDPFHGELEGYAHRLAVCGAYTIYHSRGDERLAAEIDKILCRSSEEIAGELGLETISPVAVIVAPDTRSFNELHGGRLPEWGEAFGDSRRMVIGIDASRVLLSTRPLETVVRHELSHILFSQRTAGTRCPTWLLEGIAMRQSREWTLRDQWNLALTVWRDDMPRLDDLGGRFPKSASRAAMAYRISFAAVDELLAGGERDLITFTAFLRDTGDFERAFRTTFGETVPEFSGRFEASMRSRYRKTSLILNVSPYGLTLSILFMLAYLVKRSRSRRKIEQWQREDSNHGEPN